jgi:hypothetical protein
MQALSVPLRIDHVVVAFDQQGAVFADALDLRAGGLQPHGPRKRQAEPCIDDRVLQRPDRGLQDVSAGCAIARQSQPRAVEDPGRLGKTQVFAGTAKRCSKLGGGVDRGHDIELSRTGNHVSETGLTQD